MTESAPQQICPCLQIRAVGQEEFVEARPSCQLAQSRHHALGKRYRKDPSLHHMLPHRSVFSIAYKPTGSVWYFDGRPFQTALPDRCCLCKCFSFAIYLSGQQRKLLAMPHCKIRSANMLQLDRLRFLDGFLQICLASTALGAENSSLSSLKSSDESRHGGGG